MDKQTACFAGPTTRDMLELFEAVKTIAIVGASPAPGSPGWRTAFGLHARGVQVFFVSSGASDRIGIKSVSKLSEIPNDIDIVNCWGDIYSLDDWKSAFNEIMKKKIPIIWLEPNIGKKTKTIESFLLSKKARIIKNKNIYAEYISAYSCA